jgi:hypothetical protein
MRGLTSTHIHVDCNCVADAAVHQSYREKDVCGPLEEPCRAVFYGGKCKSDYDLGDDGLMLPCYADIESDIVRI